MSKSQQAIQQNFIRLGEQVASNLLAERNDILAIYIYGSVGRGEATPYSDLDIHVVLDRKDAPEHEDRNVEGVTAGISYHTRFLYFTDLQAYISTPKGMENAASWEGLWELAADVLPIYDPKGLIPKAQAMASNICQNPDLCRLRTQLSLNKAWQILAEINQAISQEQLVDAYVRLYHLTGGDGNPGAVPLLAKAVTQRAGLSLTTRRYIYRAYQACKKLDWMEFYTGLLSLLGIEESGSSYTFLVKNRFLTAYDLAKSIFETNITANARVSSQSNIFSEETRNLFIANFDDICTYASADAAIGLAVGFSTRLLVDDNFSKASWLKTASEVDAHRLLRETAEIAGIEGDIRSVLVERSKCVENWLKTLASY